MDVSSIVKILSLFVLILSAGLISGERENNTYRLVFANPIKKTEYYLSKYCATGISVLFALIVLFLSVSVLIVTNSMVQTSGMFWLKLLFIFLTSFAYLSIFILIGLFLSTRSANAGNTVLLSVLLWITVSFIYPNLISTMVNKPMDAKNRNMNREIKQIEDNSYNVFNALELTMEQFNPMKGMLVIPISSLFDDKIQEQRLLTRIERNPIRIPFLFAFVGISDNYVLKNQLIQWEGLFPVYFQYQQDIRSQRDMFYQKKIKQQHVNHLFTCFLPDILYEQAVSLISNTDIAYRDQYIQAELRLFRSMVFDYLKSKRAFSENFFTQFPKEQWKDNWNDYTDNEKETYSKRDNYPRISYDDAPFFVLKQKNAFPVELLFIIGINLFLFFVGLFLFQNKK